MKANWKMRISGLALTLFSAAAFAAPRTVDYVDLKRYLGDWYEIGSIPQFFSKGCVCTRAQYAELPDGKISVYNTCRKDSADGKLSEAKGTATVVDPATNSKLEVSFFWPFKGDYWIVGLDKDYRYAVVSNSDASSLWILSRTPELAPDLLMEAKKIATDNGIDLSKMLTTPQTNCQYP